jgi:hypothetical protein
MYPEAGRHDCREKRWVSYLVAVEMPSVDWSSVPGARSRGYQRRTLEEATKTFSEVENQLRVLVPEAFVLMLENGQEKMRVKV